MTAVDLPRADVVRRSEEPQARRRPVDWTGIALWISLALLSVIWLAPLAFITLTSVKTSQDIATQLPWELPSSWAWDNYARAIEVGDFWVLGSNSLVIALVKVPLGLLVSALAAYALARLRFRWQRVLLAILAMGTMIPVQVALSPLFGTMLNLGLLNTKLGLLLPYLAFGISYQIFILYGFFRAIPEELDEAARIDGASNWRIFLQVILPLAKPALAALFILDFVNTWNEYPMALALLQTDDQFTLPLGITRFQTQFDTDYGALNAYIILSVIPVVIVFLLFQRYFVQGALAGAVKG